MAKRRTKRCRQCGVEYAPSKRKRKFCSLPCCWQWRREHKGAGQFQQGHQPWNAGTQGLTTANSGSFRPGQESKRKCAIGAVRMRLRLREGRARAWVKIAEGGNSHDWRLRAAVVWEAAHGPMPDGWIVHHIDGDPLNDAIENLEAVSRADHLRRHRKEFEQRRADAASRAAKTRHQRNRDAKAAAAHTAVVC